jgi:hypothetical protein
MIAPRIAAHRALGSRERLPDEKLVELFSSSAMLPAERILMVLKAIGSGYGIYYSELRPSDCLVSQLSKIDSWRFDAGAEKPEGLLRDRFNLSLPANAKSLLFTDLMNLIEAKANNARPEPK